jgi:hypothetical protein
MTKEREALKLALECIEAWDRGCSHDDYWRDIEDAITAIKEALAQPAQELDELTIAYMSGLYDGKKKRPWVELTDEEVQLYAVKHRRLVNAPAFYKAIEAALKEKNT